MDRDSHVSAHLREIECVVPQPTIKGRRVQGCDQGVIARPASDALDATDPRGASGPARGQIHRDTERTAAVVQRVITRATGDRSTDRTAGHLKSVITRSGIKVLNAAEANCADRTAIHAAEHPGGSGRGTGERIHSGTALHTREVRNATRPGRGTRRQVHGHHGGVRGVVERQAAGRRKRPDQPSPVLECDGRRTHAADEVLHPADGLNHAAAGTHR